MQSGPPTPARDGFFSIFERFFFSSPVHSARGRPQQPPPHSLPPPPPSPRRPPTTIFVFSRGQAPDDPRREGASQGEGGGNTAAARGRGEGEGGGCDLLVNSAIVDLPP
mgnify:CR=1 FL=1